MTSVSFNSRAVDPRFNLGSYPLYIGESLRCKYHEQTGCDRSFTFVGSESVYFLGMTLGIIEVIFWTAILLLVKMIHVFIPKSFETPTQIYNWIFGRAAMAFVITNYASIRMCNFFANPEEILDKDISFIFDWNHKVTACKEFLDYQLFD